MTFRRECVLPPGRVNMDSLMPNTLLKDNQKRRERKMAEVSNFRNEDPFCQGPTSHSHRLRYDTTRRLDSSVGES